MQEPVTLATDYALAAASILFGVSLWRRGSRLWALTFFFTAAGAFFGGTYHGFGGEAFWKASVYSIGLASLWLLCGATRNVAIRVAAIVLFVVYAVWMTTHDSFLWVVIDYGVTLITLTILQTAAWLRDRVPSAPWVIASVGVSIIAAIAQHAPIAYHNDVYHAIELAALWLLYRGGTLMTLVTERPMSRPT